jgi:hypothetical protein
MSNIFKRSTRILFLFISILSIPHISSAQKILGAEITYEYYGGDSFLVSLNAYVFCDANSSSFSAGELLITPEKSSAFTVYLISDGNGGMNITPVAKNTCTQCNSSSCSFKYGVQMHRYNAFVKLNSYTDCNFTFSWHGNNRNINGKGIYVEAFLNKCIYQYSNGAHNSPYFTSPPLFLPCKNSCTSWAVDANSYEYADSLSFSLVKARSAIDTIYAYPTGYDSVSPMSLSTSSSSYPCNGFSLDAETGMFTFKPTKEENAVVAIKVIQWSKDKNGNYKVIGSVMGDLELSVMDCNNNMPTLSGINGSNATLLEFCAGQSKCFTIHSYDIDTLTDTVAISWDRAIPGANFDIEAGKQFPKGTFCWTPSNADVRTNPYNFTVTASDNNSPVTGRTKKVFSLKVNSTPEASYSTKIGDCGEVTYTFYPGQAAAISKYEWIGSNGSGIVYTSGNPVKVKYARPSSNSYSSAFTYRLIITSVSGCKTVYVDSMKLPDNYLWVDLPKDFSVCKNSTINLEATRHNGKADFYYQWSIDKNGAWTNGKTKLNNIKITKDTTFWVTVKDATGCTNSDTIHIHAQKPSKPNLGPDRTECNIGGNPITLQNLDTLTKIKSIQWFKFIDSTGGSMPVSTSNTFQVKDSGKYWVLVTDVVGCTGTDTINLFLNPAINVEKKTVKACDKDSVTLVGGIANAGAKWIWQDKRYIHLGMIQHTGPTYTLQARTSGNNFFKTEYIVTVTQNINGITCKDIDTIILETYTKPSVTAGALPRLCTNASRYDLSQVSSQPSTGQNWWTYSKSDTDVISGNMLYPSVLGAGKHYVYYWHKDAASGCAGFDSTLLELDTLPKVFAGNDTFLCFTDLGLYLNQIHHLVPATGGHWRAEDSNKVFITQGSNPYFNRGYSGSFNLIYSLQDSITQCFNEETVTITVYPELTVYGGRYDTVCNTLDRLYLNGSHGGGTWHANSAGIIRLDTSGDYYFLPIVAGAGTHKLWFTASHTKGACPQTDTVYITVDSTCVWPGDANLDKTADYLDILDIALGYAATGTPRINASTDWKPQLSKDWSNTLSSGINYKHLDANGDSVIDTDDTIAVAKNYGKTHLKNEEPQLAGNSNDPPLYFQFNKNYYLAGDTVKATLYLGSADKPVKDVYGLGLKHFFANPYMESNSYKFNWDCEMLCGAKDNFQLYRQFNDKNIGEGSIIRTDKLTTNNPFGKVAEMQFVLKDSTFNYPKSGINISLQIIKSKLIDVFGNEIPVYTKADSVKVYRSQNDVVGIIESTNISKADIKIYPNPANNLVYIDGGTKRLEDISIINILGETVATINNVQTSKTSINMQNLPSGIYFVRVKAGANFNQYKLVISR